jgi:hypothetical protein
VVADKQAAAFIAFLQTASGILAQAMPGHEH